MEDESFPIYRDGDTLDLLLTEWVDSHRGHRGWLSGQIDTSAFRLYQDGQLIAQAARPQGEYTLAPDPAEYRLELDVAREAPWWTTSTQTHTAWTIQSARPAGADPELVPLLQLDFDVDLDLTNTATETSLSSFDLLVRHQPGYEGARINRAQVSVSYDDGQTWRQRPALPRGDGQFTVMLVASAPAGAEFISIRVDAADSDGNRIEQEVMRAWQLP